MTEPYSVMIRDLPADERPRERLERYGAGALGIPELLAIILRVGNPRVSALQLAQQLVSRYSGLRGLAAACGINWVARVNGTAALSWKAGMADNSRAGKFAPGASAKVAFSTISMAAVRRTPGNSASVAAA